MSDFDPDLQALLDAGDLPAIAFDHPDAWPHGNLSETGEPRMVVGADTLDADFCRIGAHRFVRATLSIPVHGTTAVFAFGPWAGVSQASFDRINAAETLGTPFEGCFAWLMNRLPGFEFDDWPPCNLMPGPKGARPTLEVHDGHHELAELQEHGLSPARVAAIYRAARASD